MTDLPRYVLDMSSVRQLSEAMKGSSLDVQPFGLPKANIQGAEQVWKCRDESGELFSFTTLEVNDKNVFGLNTGAVYLELGPREKGTRKRTRKEVSEALNRFERALDALGAQKIKR